MKKVVYLLSFVLFAASCSQQNCSDAYTTVEILQDEIKSLEKSRKKYKVEDELDEYIQKRTNKILKFIDDYETNLFTVLGQSRPESYSLNWCQQFPNDDHQQQLTKALIGDKCEIKSDGLTLGNLYRQILKYNHAIDKKLKIVYCRKNPKFKTIKSPDISLCLSEEDHFLNKNLNNHLMGLLRIKEAILLQEEVLLLKKEIKLFSETQVEADSTQS